MKMVGNYFVMELNKKYIKVNKIVRGLKVPSGINSFEMRFNPKEFYYGLFITK